MKEGTKTTKVVALFCQLSEANKRTLVYLTGAGAWFNPQ